MRPPACMNGPALRRVPLVPPCRGVFGNNTSALLGCAKYISRTNATSTSPATTPLAPIKPALPFWLKPLPQRAIPYALLARLDKPIGTWLLYIPCTWGIGMAAYHQSVGLADTTKMLALFGTGALIMRGAGCTVNDLWDRDLDSKVTRTTIRPLANGSLNPQQAVLFLGLQLSAGLGVLTQLNAYSILLGSCSLAMVGIYPLMKRITWYPQVVLGLTFSWGAMLGWPALIGGENMSWAVTLPLYLSGVTWTVIYDTIYAHQDKLDDAKASIYSMARKFGDKTKPILLGLSAVQISLLATTGYLNDHGPIFYTLSCGGALLQLLHMIWKVRLDDPANCWYWFQRSRAAGFLIFGGIFGDYVWRLWMSENESVSDQAQVRDA